MWPRVVSLVLTMIVLAAAGWARPVLAQQRELLADPPRQRPVLLADPWLEVLEQLRDGVVVNDDQFERSFFSRVGGVAHARERLESRLAWEIQRIDRSYGLTPEQKRKLEVAGRGDIKRLFEDIRKHKERLHRARSDIRLYLATVQELRPSRVEPDGFFIEGSLFVKILKTTLSPAQRARYEKDRLDFYQSRVEWALASFWSGRSTLTDEQIRRFVSLMTEKTRPLKRYGPHDFDAIWLQASKLPEEKLKPIFDDVQWYIVSNLFRQLKQRERILSAEGYLPENPPAGS